MSRSVQRRLAKTAPDREEGGEVATGFTLKEDPSPIAEKKEGEK